MISGIGAAAGFWGKAECDVENGKPLHLLPLAVHCLDVAWVFRKLAALPAIQKRMQASGNPNHAINLEEVHFDRLAVIAMFHDIGKANLGFQNKIFAADYPRAGHIRELAPFFADSDLQSKLAAALQFNLLGGWFDPPESMGHFLIAAWSHHGDPQRFDAADQTGSSYYLARTRWWRAEGEKDPFQAIAELLTAAKSAFPLAFSAQGFPIPCSPPLQHRFAGLVMLADWIGSHRSFFPLDRTCSEAMGNSCAQAEAALGKIGLDALVWQDYLSHHPSGFADKFGFSPRPIQSSLEAIPADSEYSRLIIAEAETGSGKTEAALAWFLRLFSARQVDALYFALPTRVAARELYSRIQKYIGRIFPSSGTRPPVLLAVPGYARVDGVPVDGSLPEDSTRWHDEASQVWRERAWAAENPKRFLAAPIAIGTIDQALLSALQVRHAHLRSVCLDRSLLVVDEVHASDSYMRRLLGHLLDHHLNLGGFSLLLSATLGSSARSAFTGMSAPSFAEACAAPFPALTDRSGMPRDNETGRSPLKQKEVIVQLLPQMEEPLQVMPELAGAISRGARILLMLNIVDRAIAMQRAAEDLPDVELALVRFNGVRAPHHGRFAAADREVLDLAVTNSLGKESKVGACLLIGTQTLEQSLDIDADLLITDLCPMDVLLQRIGRLHRHERKRPEGFERPRCLVLCPREETLAHWLTPQGEACGTAKKLGLGSVYPDMRVLQLTLDLLNQYSCLRLPKDNRSLVEGATHPERLASLQGEPWIKHGQRIEGAQIAQEVRAEYAALSELYRKSFGDFHFHEPGTEAKTRLGLNNLRVPLDRTVRSPFGQSLTEVAIPGHMAPRNPPESPARVLGINSKGITIEYGHYRYLYSRHGLEKIDEPAR